MMHRSSSNTSPAIWLRERRKTSHRERFLLHFVAERAMELLDFGKVPLEGCDGVRYVEVAHRKIVAGTLVSGERRLRAGEHRLREELSVDQRIGDSVSRQRIFEVAGITDERPPRAVRLPKESTLS